MTNLKWATVTQASPPMVALDGTTVPVPVVVGAGVTLAGNQRVLVSWVPPSTVVLLPAAAAAPATPAGQSVYLSSPDGAVWKLTVSNSGTLGATKQ